MGIIAEITRQISRECAIMSDQEYPYTPPKPESKLSCLKIGAISCLVLVVVIIVGSYWLYRVIASNPAFKKGLEEVKAMATCTAQLQEIYRAMERYNQKNGRYPSSLGELYPDYLENKRFFSARLISLHLVKAVMFIIHLHQMLQAIPLYWNVDII